MTTTYTERYELGHNDATFRNRCEMALLDVAVEVMSESTGTAGHAYRAGLAAQVLADPSTIARSMAVVAAASGLLEGDSTDDDIHDVLAAAWSTYSGVPAS